MSVTVVERTHIRLAILWGLTNAETNGLLRQYFLKGTDLAVHTQAHLDTIADELNNRPDKTLGWLKPTEAPSKLLLNATNALTH